MKFIPTKTKILIFFAILAVVLISMALVMQEVRIKSQSETVGANQLPFFNETATNVKLCDNMQETEFNDKDKCYLYASDKVTDISICENIQKLIYKYQCYQRIAINKKDVSVCFLINQNAAGRNWQDECLYDLAAETKNPNYCENLKNKNLVADCKNLEGYGLQAAY